MASQGLIGKSQVLTLLRAYKLLICQISLVVLIRLFNLPIDGRGTYEEI